MGGEVGEVYFTMCDNAEYPILLRPDVLEPVARHDREVKYVDVAVEIQIALQRLAQIAAANPAT